MKHKAIIFDLDGTLYDKKRMPLWLCLGSLGTLRFLAAERYCHLEMFGRYYGDRIYDEFFSRVAERTGSTPERAKSWYWNHYMPLMARVVKKHYKPFPWVIPTLEKLHQDGVRIALFSEYNFAAEKLEALGVDAGLFDVITDAPTAGGFKPCRKAFLKVAEILGVDPGDILVVGDREDTDGAGADSAGMDFLLVGPGSDPKLV